MCRSSCLKACKTITETTRKQTRKEKIFIKEEIRHSLFQLLNSKYNNDFYKSLEGSFKIQDLKFEIQYNCFVMMG